MALLGIRPEAALLNKQFLAGDMFLNLPAFAELVDLGAAPGARIGFGIFEEENNLEGIPRWPAEALDDV